MIRRVLCVCSISGVFLSGFLLGCSVLLLRFTDQVPSAAEKHTQQPNESSAERRIDSVHTFLEWEPCFP